VPQSAPGARLRPAVVGTHANAAGADCLEADRLPRYRIRLNGWKKREGQPRYKAHEEWEGKAVGRRTVIEGTYGFVYCSDNGFGMGVFTIKGEQFIGVDPAASITMAPQRNRKTVRSRWT
jgi:hypothetical protein